jgi:hypothetical protein
MAQRLGQNLSNRLLRLGLAILGQGFVGLG